MSTLNIENVYMDSKWSERNKDCVFSETSSFSVSHATHQQLIYTWTGLATVSGTEAEE